MTVNEFLSQVFLLTRKLNSLKTLKAYYEEKANSIPGGNYDEPVVQKSRENKAPFIRWIDKIVDTDKRIANVEEELNLKIKEVSSVIEKVANYDYRNLLMMRYIYLEKMEDIAIELSVSLPTIKRWHYLAKNEFEKLRPCEPL